MKGIIVLDGPDHSGKTTLAGELLTQNRGGKYMHLEYRKKANLWHHAYFKRALKYSRDNLVVLDRWWVSEEVYSYVYREGTEWPGHGAMYETMLQAAGGLYCICCPFDKEWCLRGHAVRQKTEMYPNIEDVYDIFNEFCIGEDVGWRRMPGHFGKLIRKGGWTSAPYRSPWVLPYRAPDHTPELHAKYLLNKLKEARKNAGFNVDNPQTVRAAKLSSGLINWT